MQRDGRYQIKCLGYTNITNSVILGKFLKEGPFSLLEMPGDYVVIIENSEETYIVSSPYCVTQYYYTIQKGKFYHSDTILNVLQASRMLWQWNWTALSEVLYFEHLMENETLHPEIHRVPQAAVLHFRSGRLNMTVKSWGDLHSHKVGSPEMALRAFNKSVAQWCSGSVVLSMSGGFDSRVILSSMIRQDINPLLLVMGTDDCTDVKTSRSIASKLGLKLHVVPISSSDYLDCGEKVTKLTNGTAFAYNWHSYIYLAKSGLDSDLPVFLGTNGEFARSFCSDAGVLSLMTYSFPSLFLYLFWKRFMRVNIFTQDEINGFNDSLRKEVSPDLYNCYLKKVMKLCYNRLYPGIDIFYLIQRVRNCMGNGVKLCSTCFCARMPFVSREWVNEIWNLSRRWKLGANWHRFAIYKNYPPLLKFPEDKTGRNMARKPPLLYWLPINKKAVVRYTDCPKWFQDDMFISFILDHSEILSELMEKKQIYHIVEDHKNHGNRVLAISFLLTMIFWLKQIRQIQHI